MPARIVIVSDLHAAGGDALARRGVRLDDFTDDAAFGELLRDAGPRARAAGEDATLVLLGDTLDFAQVALPDSLERRSADVAPRRLELIAHAHAGLVSALARWLSDGYELVYVVGNHDAEMALASVEARLRAVVAASGAPASARLSVRPWIYYRRGVAYAEHGHQYHDINAFSNPERPFREDGTLERTLGGALTEHRVRRAVDGPGNLGREAFSLGVRLARPAFGLLRRRGAERGPAVGDDLLPSEVVAELRALSPRTPAAIARRLFLKVVSRDRGAGPPRYLRRAAAEIDRVLRRRSLGVPFYVFGHVHRLAVCPLPGDPDRALATTGAWIRPPARFGFLEIQVPDQPTDAQRPVLSAWEWDAERGQRVPAAG